MTKYIREDEFLPCPFCGKCVDPDDVDTLHPSGIYWRFEEDIGRTYHRMRDRLKTDNACWEINCPPVAGGCGVNIIGDSVDEVVASWNRRTNIRRN